MTQVERLIDYLKTHDTGITDSEGLVKLGIGSVASRVHDLEIKRLYKFEHVWEVGKNRYGKKCRYIRYFLKEGEKENE